jgi:hypothetical protein
MERDYIVVWSDNTWEFFRCCRCGGPLEDAASRERGLGRKCMKRAAVDEVRSIKNQEREKLLLAIACRPPSVQRRSREVAYDIFRVNSGTVCARPGGPTMHQTGSRSREEVVLQGGADRLRLPNGSDLPAVSPRRAQNSNLVRGSRIVSGAHETFAQITETWSVPSTVPSFATVTSQAGLPVVSEMAYDDDTVLILTPGVELVVK